MDYYNRTQAQRDKEFGLNLILGIGVIFFAIAEIYIYRLSIILSAGDVLGSSPWVYDLGIHILLILSGTIIYAVIMILWRWWDQWLLGVQYDPKVDYNTYQHANKDANGKETTKVLNNWNKPQITDNTTGLIASDRRKPPRAEFFGRANGQPLHAEGQYEEKYLNTWEIRYWKKQKARKKAIEDGLLDETLTIEPL